MAEAPEDIIIIEDGDVEIEEIDYDIGDVEEEAESSKKKAIIYAAAGFAFIIIVVISMFLFSSPSVVEEKPVSMGYIEERLEKDLPPKVEPSKLENMIAKANYLYSTGSKKEALHLYEKIAQFSEAISNYNLGVAQLKDSQYEQALNTFKKAISNDEKRCVSAINAAVCALHLNDKDSFKYYIDLAYAYLPNEINSPLYSYYYTLINYYKDNYLEALSSLNNPTSDDYLKDKKYLAAKINVLFNNNYDAIEAMENKKDEMDVLSVGLLYARVGDLTLAQKNLQDAIVRNIEPAKAQLALGLINLKAGQVATASKHIKDVTDMFPEEVYKHYPIRVKLKDSLFDPEQAQITYKNAVKNSHILNYQKIFYFSPYKVFNANQTISYIRKGNAKMFIDDVSSAKTYLSKSSSSSNVNKGIAQAIKKALDFKLVEANNELKRLTKIQPKHSILHYNLGLTYAQLGNMFDANKHFLRSYHLDAKNYLSGVYAVMTGQLINRDTKKLKSILKDSITQEELSEDINLYRTLFAISENNVLMAQQWLENNYKKRPLYLALDIIISMQSISNDVAKSSSKELITLLPNDILPHLMYVDAHYNDLETKKYASEILNYLKVQDFHFDDLYFGPNVTRELYVKQNLIIGRLFYLRQQLKDVLETTTKNTNGLTAALALSSLYDKKFEESYTLYNQLIDELKVRDANTLFLGAVASTAASHHANAIALLELSKMKNSNFLESRYALGLLYLEVKNNAGATIQLSNVGDTGFVSEYFNFEIDTDKLLFQKNNPELQK